MKQRAQRCAPPVPTGARGTASPGEQLGAGAHLVCGHGRHLPAVQLRLQGILKNREPEPSGIEGLLDMHIIQSLLQSARYGVPVKLQGFDPAPPTQPAAAHPRTDILAMIHSIIRAIRKSQSVLDWFNLQVISRLCRRDSRSLTASGAVCEVANREPIKVYERKAMQMYENLKYTMWDATGQRAYHRPRR